MRALTINATSHAIEEKEIEMQANTVYSFFNSILIDELTTLQGHTLHTDANALSQGKQAYFLGEQLLVGDALIIGREGMSECDATISEEDLRSLANFEIPKFYEDTLALLGKTDINLYRTFALEKNGERVVLNPEWVLYAFNMADDKTKSYFLEHLEKTIEAKEDVEAYIQKMAGLALNAAG